MRWLNRVSTLHQSSALLLYTLYCCFKTQFLVRTPSSFMLCSFLPSTSSSLVLDPELMFYISKGQFVNKMTFKLCLCLQVVVPLQTKLPLLLCMYELGHLKYNSSQIHQYCVLKSEYASYFHLTIAGDSVGSQWHHRDFQDVTHTHTPQQIRRHTYTIHTHWKV